MTKVCYICEEPGDLRPYGKGGQMICFTCMKADPEREAEAKRQFDTQLEACGSVAVIDGSEVGPYPIEHSGLKKGKEDT